MYNKWHKQSQEVSTDSELQSKMCLQDKVWSFGIGRDLGFLEERSVLKTGKKKKKKNNSSLISETLAAF